MMDLKTVNDCWYFPSNEIKFFLQHMKIGENFDFADGSCGYKNSNKLFIITQGNGNSDDWINLNNLVKALHYGQSFFCYRMFNMTIIYPSDYLNKMNKKYRSEWEHSEALVIEPDDIISFWKEKYKINKQDNILYCENLCNNSDFHFFDCFLSKMIGRDDIPSGDKIVNIYEHFDKYNNRKFITHFKNSLIGNYKSKEQIELELLINDIIF